MAPHEQSLDEIKALQDQAAAMAAEFRRLLPASGGSATARTT
jgi:hypothetical protein